MCDVYLLRLFWKIEKYYNQIAIALRIHKVVLVTLSTCLNNRIET